MGLVRASTGPVATLKVSLTNDPAKWMMTRTDAGSFIVDKFFQGDEMHIAGFGIPGNNGSAIIDAIVDKKVILRKPGRNMLPMAAEDVGAVVSLAAGLPEQAVFEGVGGDPDTARPYWRESFKPFAGGEAQSIGVNPRTTSRVLYLVDYFIPSGVTERAAEETASYMAKALKPGTTFTAESSRVEITKVTSEGSRPTTNGTMIPIQITLRVDHQE